MHFHVQCVVRLDEPVEVLCSEGGDHETDNGHEGHEHGRATGFVLELGINAIDMAEAAGLAQLAAMAPDEDDDEISPLAGHIEHAEIEAIEKDSWSDEVLEQIDDLDQPGIYFSSGRMFFDHDETDDADDA